jgi:hypothetical protein
VQSGGKAYDVTMKSPVGLIAVASLLFVCTDLPAHGLQCPKESPNGPSQPSEARTLEGRLIYHDGMRKWFELKLDRPECGQASVELFPGRSAFSPGNPAGLETFRGCRVRTEGPLGGAASGYYTLDINLSVGEIEPIGKCTRQPPLPDFSKAKPDKSIHSYRVGMTIDYEQADHPIFLRVTSGGKVLQPWQAYASYFLTGGYVLYGYCAKGFTVDRVFGDSEASPQHFEERGSPNDAAMFDPDDTDGVAKKKLQLGYTCMCVP